MVANALLLSVALLLALLFYLMGELKFLVPHRVFLLREYGWALGIFFGGLFLNFFAGAFVLIRKSFLKDTGRKLSHIDKQFHVGDVHLPADSDYDERS
jgi:small-conductance mechanosensitive channel